jgi:lysophospholipase L1-like esterase
MVQIKDLPFVDNYVFFKNLPHLEDYLWVKDRWHPNAKGYKLLAENIYNCILEDNLIK